jgi:hypothetical protein
MRKLLSKIGKIFIELNQKNEDDIRQSVLIVDGSFILPNNFALIIKGVKKKFVNAKIVVLTFKDKAEFIKDNFPDAVTVVPEEGLNPKKYQLAIKLFYLLCNGFDFIVLSSLDISLLLVVAMFARCPIYLHNRWMEWHRIKKATLADLLHKPNRSDSKRRRLDRGIKDIIKSLGRIFLIVTDFKEEDIKCRILVEDNGYTEVGHVLTAVRRAQELFINPDITILTFARRKQDFTYNFSDKKLVIIGENSHRYSLAMHMLKMHRQKIDYIILSSLDASPIIISCLFFKAKILLYNHWHQWWALRFRNLFGYLKWLLVLLVMIPLYFYLFVVAIFVLMKTRFRLGLSTSGKP